MQSVTQPLDAPLAAPDASPLDEPAAAPVFTLPAPTVAPGLSFNDMLTEPHPASEQSVEQPAAGAAAVPVAALPDGEPLTAEQPAFAMPAVETPAPTAPTLDLPSPTPPAALSRAEVAAPSATTSGREFDRLLEGLVLGGGSDMHLRPDNPPRYRVAGAVRPVHGEKMLSSAEIDAMLSEALPAKAWEEYSQNGDLDTSYALSREDGSRVDSRFRVNVFRTLGKTAAVIRVIPTKIKTLDELGAPAQIARLAGVKSGFVLFTGPVGSGKSTTAAALLDVCNSTRDDVIITLEDPVEFTHTSKRCLVAHREVGEDTPTFAEGLRRIRREDPNIVYVGEMRDYETIAAAIEAADSGALVVATLHSNSAPETISRIVNVFPANQQDQVRVTLASTLLAVVCQALVPHKNGDGRVLAAEVLMVSDGVRNSIRTNDIPAIEAALLDHSSGNQLMDWHLAEMFRNGLITKKAAYSKARKADALTRFLDDTAGR